MHRGYLAQTYEKCASINFYPGESFFVFVFFFPFSSSSSLSSFATDGKGEVRAVRRGETVADESAGGAYFDEFAFVYCCWWCSCRFRGGLAKVVSKAFATRSSRRMSSILASSSASLFWYPINARAKLISLLLLCLYRFVYSAARTLHDETPKDEAAAAVV